MLARYWHKEKDKIQCDLCPKACILKEGQSGFCFVRQNQGGQLIAKSYGRPTGFAVDPVEKKPLYHFYPNSSVLSFGTIGCNLGCKFCQNWHISRAKKIDEFGKIISPKEVARLAYDKKCKSVAFTYNEPIIFAEYAIDTAKECCKLGIKTIAVSNGYISTEARSDFFYAVDAVNIDLKSFSNMFYKKICQAELEPVLDTLIYIKEKTSAWLEITNLVVPGENDSKEEINNLTKWIHDNLGSKVPLHFSAFHSNYLMQDTPATSCASLVAAKKIAEQNGLEYIYLGNISDNKNSSTYCPNCHEVLIERTGYNLDKYALKDSLCQFCNTKIDGHF